MVCPEPETPSPFISEHIWYVHGYPDGSFRPSNSITRAEFATALFRLIESDYRHIPQPSRFSDVGTQSWYAQPINYLAGRGMLLGYPDGTFRPNQAITRAELTAAIARFFALTDTGANHFTDVYVNHWAIRYINNAHNRGWIVGYADGTFRPDNAITRAEAVMLINRVLGRIPNPVTIDYHLEGLMLFTDLTPAHWAFYQVMEAAIEHEYMLCESGLEVWTYIISLPPHYN